ncbi:lytic transglycosylase domain-containing protein [Thiohalobacter thiocyanaticus]|uniref:Lytic transglycosylase domain-containing protein n=1 Tax=Thiohalobacter thiocyanaticus TaxID=585455 RepID=A0A426QHE1_9GAMM|nr:lytic transglycosylase domain-containing protein [Thiohalobacter thiocyanaticus]RRQ21178.1 lytic transglycosylase domain-containing protein [Thiohalobacter thiocyanaticus]
MKLRLQIPRLVLLLTLAFSQAAQAATQARPDAEMRAHLAAAIASAESFEDRFEAEVWLSDMSRRLQRRWQDIPANERLEILRIAHQEATQAELPPELVLAVIQVESNFDRFAISHAGARGLMQVMPFWLEELGRPQDNLFHIRTNIRYGCTILKHYLERERGNLQRALARYNGSLGQSWYPDRVFSALNRHWFQN